MIPCGNIFRKENNKKWSKCVPHCLISGGNRTRHLHWYMMDFRIFNNISNVINILIFHSDKPYYPFPVRSSGPDAAEH
jgi:hypothetical protein